MEWIIKHNLGTDTVWHICDISLYSHEDSDWVLGNEESQQRNKAKLFTNKKRAERVAAILSYQECEYGGKRKYEVEEA